MFTCFACSFRNVQHVVVLGLFLGNFEVII